MRSNPISVRAHHIANRLVLTSFLRYMICREEAEQFMERQRRRKIQYRWICRLILRHKTGRSCTSRPPVEGHPEGTARPWRTSMEPANVPVKWAHEPWPT